MDDRAEEVARRSIRAWAIGMLVLLTLLVGGWLAVRAVSAAICADYNSISNDFCDKWHYETPPGDAIPMPAGWRIVWHALSCGSGGCPRRSYVLIPPVAGEEPIASYLQEIAGLGWRQAGPGDAARKDDLVVNVGRASDNVGRLLVPERLGRPEYVYVSLGICGEATTC